MRDIRGDLQDRASFLEEQIATAQAQHEKRMELFTREHEAKIDDLQAELEAVIMLMEREYRRIMAVPELAEEPRAAAQAEAEPQTATHAGAYDERDYAIEEDFEQRAEEESYREPARAEAEPEPAPQPVEEPTPMRQPERAAPRAAENYQRPVAEELRPRRPIPVEQPVAERSYDRFASRAPQPRDQEPQRRMQPSQRGSVSAQRPPLADFLIRKLGEAGALSLDDLCGIAIQEGYFTEGDNPDRAVHTTLMNVVKAGFIRQMPNGAFAPASVMDTIRLRRAI